MLVTAGLNICDMLHPGNNTRMVTPWRLVTSYKYHQSRERLNIQDPRRNDYLEVYLYLDENLSFELLKLCGHSKDHSTTMMRLERFVEENFKFVPGMDI